MHQRISDVLLDGFAAYSVQEGETVHLINRESATSDSNAFYIYAEQIAGLVFPQLDITTDTVDRYLMVLHEDNTADVYINDLRVEAQVRVTRPIEAGELVRRNDMSAIEELRFPDVSMAPGDRVVYFARHGWRFGIAFDLTRTADAASIGALCAQLQTKLILEDMLQLTLAEIDRADKLGADAFIITEGKTDWRHLERGLREVGYRRKLGYDRSDQDRGDAKLLDVCEALALEPRNRPVVCVFDRDNPAVLKQLAKADPENRGYQDWGNNVYSFALPVPEHRRDYANVSIEMLYRDDLLARSTSDGRRLCFDNEVRKELMQHRVLRTVLVAPDASLERSKKVVGSDVDAIENDEGRKACLSKARFAELIHSKAPPFESGDFSAFIPVAELMEQIIAVAIH